MRRIPVVVLTTSAADTDVATCYDRGANSYITKPLDFGEFGVLVRDAAGNMVPMDQAYMDNLKATVHEGIEDFWVSKQAEAFATHGEAILKPQ